MSEKTALTTNPRKRVYSDSKKNYHSKILANGLEALRKKASLSTMKNAIARAARKSGSDLFGHRV